MIGRRGFITGRQAAGLVMAGVPVLAIVGGTIAVTGWALGLFVWGFAISMTACITVGMKLFLEDE